MNGITVGIFSILFLAGNIGADGRILRGSDVDIKDFPYVVSIKYSGVHWCAGAIISNKHILTAAHCTAKGLGALLEEEFEFEQYMVHTATSKSDEIGIAHRVRDVHAHPEWAVTEDGEFPNDIAVLTLEDPIVFDENQQKVNLPSHDVQNNEIANITGWGLTTNTDNDRKQLEKLQVNVLSFENCVPLISHKIHEEQVCAYKNTGTANCYADGGSPLVSNGEIIGVGSVTDMQGCNNGSPDIYTNVFGSKSFIESVIANE